jgi:integrase
VKLPNGKKKRIFGTPELNTKEAAKDAERAEIERVRNGDAEKAAEQEVPTFDSSFNGRFWREWVIGRKNKPSEANAKKNVYENHLKQAFGHLRLDEIGVAHVADFRATLVEKKLKEKTINNVLGVLSKPLRYALDAEVIARAPKIGLLKHERPEIVCWDIDQYARILEAAREAGREWYAAACLAGEAGLRVGEVKALRWREDVDLVAGTITVNQQVRHGLTGTPKGAGRVGRCR